MVNFVLKEHYVSMCIFGGNILGAHTFSSWFLILHLVNMEYNQFALVMPDMHLSHLIKQS
jgi:hypothetical protein